MNTSLNQLLLMSNTHPEDQVHEAHTPHCYLHHSERKSACYFARPVYLYGRDNYYWAFFCNFGYPDSSHCFSHIIGRHCFSGHALWLAGTIWAHAHVMVSSAFHYFPKFGQTMLPVTGVNWSFWESLEVLEGTSRDRTGHVLFVYYLLAPIQIS